MSPLAYKTLRAAACAATSYLVGKALDSALKKARRVLKLIY